MSHECCKSSSCGSHSHSHSHEGGAGCKNCCDQHCHCPCHKNESSKYSKQLLELADEAWMEVVKEKIKEEILKTSSDHLNELAKLVSDANKKRWQEKMEERSNEIDFEERLKNTLFSKNKK